MASTRAVLADITDLGLDPNTPHKSTGASGRLRPRTAAEVAAAVEETPEPVVVVDPLLASIEVPAAEVTDDSDKSDKKGKRSKKETVSQ